MAYSNFYSWWLGFLAKTKSSFKVLWHYKPNRWHFLIYLFLLSIISWQAYSIYYNLSGNLLVLRYRIDFGASLIGEAKNIFYYPILSLSFFIFNFILALVASLQNKNRFLYNLIFVGNNVITIFISLYLMSVYLVNFS